MKISGFVSLIHVMALIMMSFSLLCCIILYVVVVWNEHSDSSHFPTYFVKPESDVCLKKEPLYCHVSRIGQFISY